MIAPMHMAYEAREIAPEETVVEVGPDGYTLRCPLTARWKALSEGVVFLVVAGVMGVMLALWAFGVGDWGSQLSLWPLTIYSTVVLGGGAIGWREFWMYRRYGHLGRRLEVNVRLGEVRFREERGARWRRCRLDAAKDVYVLDARRSPSGTVVVVHIGQWRTPVRCIVPKGGESEAKQFVECMRGVLNGRPPG